MERKCSRCEKMYKFDKVCSYSFSSDIEAHTFWNMDLCFTCRDEILKFIDDKHSLQAKLDKAVEALEPFTHEDLSFKFSNNCQGNESIIFQRNNAILTIGDIKRAQEALTDIKALQVNSSEIPNNSIQGEEGKS